jgi:hypothetical protein
MGFNRPRSIILAVTPRSSFNLTNCLRGVFLAAIVAHEAQIETSFSVHWAERTSRKRWAGDWYAVLETGECGDLSVPLQLLTVLFVTRTPQNLPTSRPLSCRVRTHAFPLQYLRCPRLISHISKRGRSHDQ